MEFLKFEKELMTEFQLVYTDLEPILDWPNAYLAPSQVTPVKSIHLVEESKLPIQK